MTENPTTEEILVTMDDLDRTRRALDEREMKIARRENEVDTKLEAAVDRDSSAVRLREECDLEIQRIQETTGTVVAILERRVADAETTSVSARTSLASLAGRLEGALGRVKILTEELAKRDQWNQKIMDEREAVIGRLSTAERTVLDLRRNEQTLNRSNESLQMSLAEKRREHEDLVRKYNAFMAKIREAGMARRSR